MRLPGYRGVQIGLPAGWLRHAVAGDLHAFHNASAGTLVSTECLRAELEAAGFKNLGEIFLRGRE